MDWSGLSFFSESSLAELRNIVGASNVLWRKADLQTYEYDGYLQRCLPDAVVFVESTEEVASVARLAQRDKIPFVPRGRATGLTGGSVPVNGGLVIELARMNRVLETDTDGERMIVEAGIYNQAVSDALQPLGYYYAPDPGSAKASSIGGNIAHNAGGPHCFKYGVTANHVLGAEVVLSDGDVVWLGGKALDLPGFDLTGAFVGSEGTCGICTKAVLRILPKPEVVETLLVVYESVDDAAASVSATVAAGMIPATLELMDQITIRAIEDCESLGYPRDAGAILLIELDGLFEGVEAMTAEVTAICRQNRAREVRLARTDDERDALWRGRRAAIAAIARLAPNYLIVDGTVPRTQLPAALKRVAEIAEKYGLVIANIAHAGDGNMHPTVLFDSSNAADRERAARASHEILAACVELGGTISGEHGIGLEKIEAMQLLFTEDDLRAQDRMRAVFDPSGLCNPGKVLPPLTGAEKRQAGPGRVVPAPRLVEGPMPDIAGVTPAARAAPAGVEELRDIVAWAEATGKTLAPVGAGTKLEVGNPPSRLDLAIDLTGLARVIDYDPENLVITAQAGARIGGLRSLVRADSLVLPLDPNCGPEATIGGVLSCADHGPRRLQYGSLRDLALGLRAVLPDSSLVRWGGQTLKNVAGYDFGKLFIGSLGSIGVVTEVTVRLLPQPGHEELLLLPVDLESGRRLALQILSSPLRPSALELLSPLGVRALGLQEISPSANDRLMLVGLEGPIAAVERQVRDIGVLSLGVTPGRSPFVASEAGLDPAQVWGTFPALRQTSASQRPAIGLRCTVPVASGWEAAAAAEALSRTHAVRVAYSLSCGSGYLEVHAVGEAANLREFTRALRSEAERLGGAASVLQGWAALGPDFDAWGSRRSDYPLMRRMKQTFDPHGIMNPGRFVGGL